MATISDWLDDFDIESDFIDPLYDGGWFHYIFPFLLVYAIIITVLNNVRLFSEANKAIRVVISLVFALFAVVFEINDRGETVGDLLMALFPGVTAFSMAILALYIVAAMLGVDLMNFMSSKSGNNWLKYVLGALGVFVVAYYFAKGFGWHGFEGSALEEFLTDPVLYILIVAGFLFWFLVRDDDEFEKATRKYVREMRESDKYDLEPWEGRNIARRHYARDERDQELLDAIKEREMGRKK